MTNQKSKGNTFEREMAKILSLWWSDGKSDDLCWRSSSSGGRATQRAAKGKTTKGAAADLTPVGDEMIPFFDCFIVELKKGYNTDSIQDLIDKTKSVYSEWIDKCISECSEQGIPFFIIMHKRDRRKTIFITNYPKIGRNVLKENNRILWWGSLQDFLDSGIKESLKKGIK